MRAWIAAALAAAFLAGTTPLAASPLADALSCTDASIIAERVHALPAGLLGAIGRIESGRSNIVSGVVLPWPWTINVAGEGRTYPDKPTAIRAVVALQQSGFRSIDVGCFQINLLHHPAAFISLEDAFDPQSNALYAARFLRSLQARDQSWDAAIAAYHSSTPGLADGYRARVIASWAADRGLVISNTPISNTPIEPPRLAGTHGSGAKIWSMSRQSMGVRVWTAGNFGSNQQKNAEKKQNRGFSQEP